MKPRAIVVCVEYWDLLELTLPSMLNAFDEVLVVTSSADVKTREVAKGLARVFVTDAFYDQGAPFNKGKAINEALHQFGKFGLRAVVDADIVFPPDPDWSMIRTGFLYCPKRRILPDPEQYHADLDWAAFPLTNEGGEFPGYCQIWDADDETVSKEPLYPVHWRHAGGSDSDFMFRWKSNCRVRLPWNVLHLGLQNQNWHGRVTPMLDGTVPPGAAERDIDHKRDREIRVANRDYSHEFVR